MVFLQHFSLRSGCPACCQTPPVLLHLGLMTALQVDRFSYPHFTDEVKEAKPFARGTHLERRGDRKHGHAGARGEVFLCLGVAGREGSEKQSGETAKTQLTRGAVIESWGGVFLVNADLCVTNRRGEKKEAWFLNLSSAALTKKPLKVAGSWKPSRREALAQLAKAWQGWGAAGRWVTMWLSVWVSGS